MNSLTPKNIIASKERKDKEYPDENLMRIESAKTKHYQSKNGKVSYWGMQFRDENGNWVPCKLKINNQIISSKAKLPVHNPESSKFVSISINKIKRENIEGGDNVREDYDENSTEEEKKKIDDRYNKSIDEIKSNNEMLYKALNIIAEEFELLFNKEKLNDDYAPYPYILKSDVRKPYQDTANTDRGEIKLDSKIFRIRLDVVKENINYPETAKYVNRIGFFNLKTRVFSHTVFTKIGVPAHFTKTKMVKKKPKKRPIYLNTENVGDYITYKSKVSGEIDFSKANSCKEHNMMFKFLRVYVKRHKSNIKQELHNDKELEELHETPDGFKNLNDDSDEAPDYYKLKEENKSDDEISDDDNSDNSDNSNNSDSEPSENDSSDDENIIKISKKLKSIKL